jgi:hypothetical protein
LLGQFDGNVIVGWLFLHGVILSRKTPRASRFFADSRQKAMIAKPPALAAFIDGGQQTA